METLKKLVLLNLLIALTIINIQTTSKIFYQAKPKIKNFIEKFNNERN